MARKIVGTISDATLPKTPITIGDREYNLCFDLCAMAEAETMITAEWARAGRTDEANLLKAMPKETLATTLIVFAAAVRTFHPELDFDSAKRLVTWENVYMVAIKVREAWLASAVDEETAAAVPTEATA